MGLNETKIKLRINGELVESSVPLNLLLLDFIREKLNLTGTKWGCLTGDCGACTILYNDLPVDSCVMLASEANGAEITTIEGLAKDGELDRIQRSFIEKGAAQCGYCTSGFLMSAKALLEPNPNPTEKEVKHCLSGNLCRCTGYNKIVDAVLDASTVNQGSK